ncbi:hypothetical protein B7755_017480 [Streptomyces sp. NBS 14/10]|uniref:hypothetical protein n=1 Tax=Streptomyces sp. NBS 14/10 TaxID=1945643 RepID=UPI000B7E18EA|nr:hypothetical protein [Streptomyces sp. NBS 14/10]KAK1179773.1 hypothetical protein B7755_017480 [Streptomyces sp. NBS 14/10]NUS82573.1 hypothetical protein [Streptomyces sp.]
MNDPHAHDDMPGMDRLVAAGRVPPPRPEVMDATREAVRAAIREAERAGEGRVRAFARSGRSPGTGRFGRRTASRTLLTVAAAAVAAAVTLIAVDGRDERHRPTTTVAAGTAHDFLSEVAEAQSAKRADWNDAPYWKIVVERTTADGSRTEKQTLLAHHAGRLSHLRVKRADQRRDRPSAGPGLFPVGTRSLTWDEVNALPTDPAALDKLLRSSHNPVEEPAEGLYAIVGDLLTSPASPKLRAALYQVAARLPGVRLLGEKATDSAGRTGRAVERGEGKVVIRYLIDPSDGRLLETVVIAARELPAVPASSTPRPDSVTGGVPWGFDGLAGRPALHPGDIIERTTFRTIGPATTDAW